ncbi:hypothetical protein Tco_1547368 [Tanacetum coccineum]
MGEASIIFSKDKVYKFEPLDPLSKSTPSKSRMKQMIISITHYLCNMIIPESDGTQKFTDEVDELRAISGHILGASGVLIPENNFDNLQSICEEDRTSEIVDPPDLVGSEELEILDSEILDLLLDPTNFGAMDLLL